MVSKRISVYNQKNSLGRSVCSNKKLKSNFADVMTFDSVVVVVVLKIGGTSNCFEMMEKASALTAAVFK